MHWCIRIGRISHMRVRHSWLLWRHCRLLRGISWLIYIIIFLRHHRMIGRFNIICFHFLRVHHFRLLRIRNSHWNNSSTALSASMLHFAHANICFIFLLSLHFFKMIKIIMLIKSLNDRRALHRNIWMT